MPHTDNGRWGHDEMQDFTSLVKQAEETTYEP